MTIRKRRKLILLLILLLSGAVAGFLFWNDRQEGSTSSKEMVNASLLRQLKQQPNADIDLSHLDKSLLPPTNRWFSGAVLNNEPQAVFPMPYSVKPAARSLEIGLPKVNTTPNTIFGPHIAQLTLNIPEATSFKASYYDEMLVRLSYLDDSNQEAGEITIGAGSPFIFYKASDRQTMSIQAPRQLTKLRSDLYVVSDNTQKFAIVTSGPAAVTSADGKINIALEQDETLTVYAVPLSTSADGLYPFAKNILTETKVAWDVTDDTAKTQADLTTNNDNPTVFAAMPHHEVTKGKKLPGSYDTIYGKLRLYEGNSIEYESVSIEPSDTLKLDTVSTEQKSKLLAVLKSDLAATNLSKTDSYFAGKELYRAANLLHVANQLNEDAISKELATKIDDTLSEWFDTKGYEKRYNKYFYYDTTVKGLVATEPAFGSENFNDHHFHYGYYIYAAATLAKYQPEFKQKYSDFVNLIVADIANPVSDKYFPARRTFDAYKGHSWASGYGAFADGNNQESSSEAINAWNAVALWANTTNNATLRKQAVWMLSNEVAAADRYWIGIRKNEKQYDEYEHDIVSLNWGGKRDYATFFSAAPAAQLGIQLIPLPPSMRYLKDSGNRITTNTAEALKGTNSHSTQFGDYILMYSALQKNDESTLTLAENLPAEFIDDANSRSYMIAWILSNK